MPRIAMISAKTIREFRDFKTNNMEFIEQFCLKFQINSVHTFLRVDNAFPRRNVHQNSSTSRTNTSDRNGIDLVYSYNLEPLSHNLVYQPHECHGYLMLLAYDTPKQLEWGW